MRLSRRVVHFRVFEIMGEDDSPESSRKRRLAMKVKTSVKAGTDCGGASLFCSRRVIDLIGH